MSRINHDDEYEYDDEYSLNDSCPKCGRSYDEIEHELQLCKKCGWDSEHDKYEKPIRPTNEDYLAGEADIITGRWY